jgi:hypothetical protein
MYNNADRARTIRCKFGVVDGSGNVYASAKVTAKLAKKSKFPKNSASKDFSWSLPSGHSR